MLKKKNGEKQTFQELEAALRTMRVRHTAYAVMASLVVASLGYMERRYLHIVLAQAWGFANMLLCLWVLRRCSIDAAARVLVWGMYSSICALMWISEGLSDVTILTYPIILIAAGMLLQPREFFVLLAATLGFVLFVGFSTEVWHLRVDVRNSGPYGHLRDACIILSGSAYAVWVIVSDVRASMAGLTHISTHDPLTSLANRTMGRDRIEQSIAMAKRRDSGVAVLFVDMDNFKAINDSLGHEAGDEFLKIIALRLLSAVRESDSVIRHGGDEFVIAMDDVQDSTGVAKIASAVMAALAQPLVLRGTEVAASCSIGIAMYPNDAAEYENLLRLADIAMYQAKQAGRNSYQFYDPVLHIDNQNSLHLIARIRAGLANNEFVNFYQPVYDAASEKLIGAEALVRWQHPEMGIISPIQFIGAAEKSGLVVEMGQFVLFEACRQMAQWNVARKDSGLPLLSIAVNLSPVQFRRAAVETLVEEALSRSGLPAACLELEITESTLVEDTERFMASLQRIKALGPTLSIDDFGTGYSNLAYLQRFAVHKLKIDQSFVKDLLKGPQQQALVSAIIQLAKSLDLVSHAEGVENEQTLQMLRQMGCDFAQGYYFAKPESAQDFGKRLSTAP